MKGLYLLTFILVASIVQAQIPNAEFSSGSETAVDGWEIKSGSAGVFFSTDFKTSIGDTVVAADGANDKFALVSNNGSTPGVLETEFAWNERSADLYGRFIYLPQSALQRFKIEIIFLDWIPALLRNDTMVHASYSINPFNNELVRNYNWFDINMEIEPRFYRLSGNPDSCIIRITTDAGSIINENTSLIIDNFNFGTGLIASASEFSRINTNVYPNPSSGTINISDIPKGASLTIRSVDGKVVFTDYSIVQPTITCNLNTGIYFITVQTDSGRKTFKVIVQ